MTTLVVIAKEPLPGKVKTRLHPPLSLDQAAELAAAAISDTFEALAWAPASRRILAFDGTVVPEACVGYEVLAQSDGDLDERLGAIFDACVGPTVLIGMDTPQVTAADLAPVFASWARGTASSSYYDAWFGPASDGGFWALGMREPDGDLIRGVRMSRDDTGTEQYQRLIQAGLRVGILPTLTDVDTMESARIVADCAPRGLFASTLASFEVNVAIGASA